MFELGPPKLKLLRHQNVKELRASLLMMIFIHVAALIALWSTDTKIPNPNTVAAQHVVQAIWFFRGLAVLSFIIWWYRIRRELKRRGISESKTL